MNATIKAENLNHPDDIYLYFNGGFIVWNMKDRPISVHSDTTGDVFVLQNDGQGARKLTVDFNTWAKVNMPQEV